MHDRLRKPSITRRGAMAFMTALADG